MIDHGLFKYTETWFENKIFSLVKNAYIKPEQLVYPQIKYL